jgi:hypothetical protein
VKVIAYFSSLVAGLLALFALDRVGVSGKPFVIEDALMDAYSLNIINGSPKSLTFRNDRGIEIELGWDSIGDLKEFVSGNAVLFATIEISIKYGRLSGLPFAERKKLLEYRILRRGEQKIRPPNRMTARWFFAFIKSY